MIEKLKYPVGKFQVNNSYSQGDKKKYIETIEHLPIKLYEIIENLSPADFEFSYRPNGWNIRQVVHHLADSHMNAFIRFKLSLTEENPIIKPYDENAFVHLNDCCTEYISSTLSILEGLHKKWVAILKTMSQVDFERTYFHPESGRAWALKHVLALYAWHCEHHLAHINQALYYKGTF